MGRTKPPDQLSAERLEEVRLAEAVDRAVARVLERERTTDEQVLDGVRAELQDALDEGGDRGRAALVPPITLPLVFLDGLEVTQEIQDLQQSVPLVGGRPTIVRAYLRYAPSTVLVRGELRVSRSANGPWQTVPSLGQAELDPTRSGSTLDRLRTRRANLRFSLNFRLPDAFTGSGQLFLRMGPVQRVGGTVLPSLAGLPVKNVTIRPTATLRMRLVRFRYTMGNPPRTHEPSATDGALIASWLRRAYPIGQLQLSTTTVTANPAPPFDASAINAQLIALRAVDVSTGTDRRTHYYGMVADSGFFMRGLASGIPQTPSPGTVASGPTGPATFGWDGDGSYGDWYGGHELGHTLGRFHVEFCGAGGGAPYPFPEGQLSGADEAFVGLDVGDPSLNLPMRVIGGVDGHDVMSYCDDQWLSSFTYGGVYTRLVAEQALPAGSAAGPLNLGDERAVNDMRVIASLNLTTSSGAITAVLPATGDPDSPEDQDDDRAGYPAVVVRVRGDDGEVLAEYPVSFRRSSCEDPGDDVTGVVDATVPPVPGAASVELVVDGSVVDTQAVGGRPVVAGDLTRADRGPGRPGEPVDGPLELAWSAPDAPAGQRYIVQLSDDGGETWRTVGVGLAEPAVTVPADELAGDEIAVRVLATTGTGTTVVRTDTVRVR